MSGQERMAGLVDELQAIDPEKYTEEVAWPLAVEWIEVHDEFFEKCSKIFKDLTDEQIEELMAKMLEQD